MHVRNTLTQLSTHQSSTSHSVYRLTESDRLNFTGWQTIKITIKSYSHFSIEKCKEKIEDENVTEKLENYFQFQLLGLKPLNVQCFTLPLVGATDIFNCYMIHDWNPFPACRALTAFLIRSHFQNHKLSRSEFDSEVKAFSLQSLPDSHLILILLIETPDCNFPV